MFGFDKLFDFNGDGKLDFWEGTAQMHFIDQMMTEEETSFDGDERDIFADAGFDDDERDAFSDAGLDYDELEFMDPEERREALEDAGLDPDDYDFWN